MDFKFTKYSKRKTLHRPYQEKNKWTISKHVNNPVLFELVKTYQIHAHSRLPASNTVRKNVASYMVNTSVRKKLLNTTRFLNFLIINKDIKSKRNFADNYCHNILRLFDVLPSFSFPASETKCNYL